MNKGLAAYIRIQGLKKFVDRKTFDRDAVIPDSLAVAERILRLAPMSELLRQSILTGYQGRIKADTEFSSKGGGINSYYPAYQINHAITLADRYLSGDTRLEIGMKYPRFNLKAFRERFNISGPHKVPARPQGKSMEGVFFDLYADEGGASIYTFEHERASEGGYAGAIFTTEESGFAFIDWLLSKPSHYLKDLDIGYNGLGGWGISEFDACKDLSFLQK